MKTAELTGTALDWAVAKCAGWTNNFCDASCHCLQHRNPEGVCKGLPRFSTDWSEGGPIIERAEIGTQRNAPCSSGREWEASPSITAKGAGGKYGYGPTPLIAAMRCYVASKLGDEVDIPEELL